MKKVSLLFMTLLVSMATRAYDAQINGIYYNLNNSSRTASVTGLTGGSSGNSSAYSGEVEIPESITYGSGTYNVTAIGDYAFKDCTTLIGVVIPSTVTSFGEDTFFGCTGLKYVIALIETPFEIPQHTFYYNSKSEGIKPLSHLLFVLGDTWSWKWNNWGSSPKSDGNTFSVDVDGIETQFDVISVKDRTCKLHDGFGAIPKTVAGVYTIPEHTCGLTVTGIGYGAFMDCAQLTGIIIPNTVTDIDIIPFMNCTSLTSITIPSSVKSIKGATFKLTNITEVKVDEANVVYDSRDNCNAIIETSTNTLVAGCKTSTIPNTVTAIADMAFEGTGIAAIDIPEQVTSIGASAFRYCDKLVSVTVEMRVPVVITEDAFTNRANATLHVPYGSKAAYEAADYWKEFKEIVEMELVSPAITFADANVKALCVANWDTDGNGELSEAEAAAVTSLGNVFTENKNIHLFEELRFFTGLTKIDKYSFHGCTWLESINIGNNVEEIGEGAFWECVSLTNLIIPDNVVSIGTMAFCKTYLKSLTIGSKLTAIGSSAFDDTNDGQLASIVVKANNSKYDSRNNCNAIIETESNTLVLGCKNTIIPNSVKTIGFRAFNNAFNNFDNPTVSLDIPAGVATISRYAFRNCQALGSVFIPSTVETIGDYAFDGCHKLVSVSIDKSIPVNINSHTFSNSKNATLYVPFGSKDAYAAADYWKEFKEIVEIDNRSEQTLALEELPVLTYGDEPCQLPTKTEQGLPLSWEIISDHSVASFPDFDGWRLVIEGTGTANVTATQVGNDDYKPFSREFTLTVNKAMLTVTADDKTKQEGEENPEMTVSYSGFKYSDDASVLTTPPTVNTTATKDSPAGSYPVTVSGAAADNYEFTYVGGTLTVTERPAVNDILTAVNAEGMAGKQATLEVALTNEDEVKLCQFDLRLPSGVIVATKSNGKLDARLTERAETHTVSGKQLDNGDYRFLISSMDNDSFTGNSGTLMEIKLDISATMEAGEYTVKLLNAELSVPDGNDLMVVRPTDTESKLIVKDYTPGDVNNDGSVSVTDVGCTINYILEQVPSVFVFEAADMNGDKTVSVTDVGMIINLILNEGVSGSRGMVEENDNNDYHFSPNLSLQAIDDGYELQLEDKDAFIGFQFDVELSNGTIINGVQLNRAADSDHLLTYRRLDNGKWRVVCYSPTNSTFVADNTALLTISTTGDITVSDIRLTTAGLDELRPADLVSMPTGIANVEQHMKMGVQGKTLCINSDRDTTLRLLTIGGSVCRILHVHRGQNSFDGLRAGIYMIDNKKIIIR